MSIISSIGRCMVGMGIHCQLCVQRGVVICTRIIIMKRQRNIICVIVLNLLMCDLYRTVILSLVHCLRWMVLVCVVVCCVFHLLWITIFDLKK